LAGASGGDHLLRMLRVRRREHDRVDLRIRERRRVAVDQRDAVALGEGARLLLRSGHAGREAKLLALALDTLDEVLAPAAEADDCRADHSAVLRLLSHRGDDCESAQRPDAEAYGVLTATLVEPRVTLLPSVKRTKMRLVAGSNGTAPVT